MRLIRLFACGAAFFLGPAAIAAAEEASAEPPEQVHACLTSTDAHVSQRLVLCGAANAADPENLDYLRELASLILNEYGYQHAKPYLDQMVERGDARAAHESGMALYFGNGVDEDHEKAAEYLSRAVDAGFGPSMAWLGRLHELGHGVEKDLTKARRLYRRATETDTPGDGTLFLGYMLIDGDEVDVEEGIKLLNEHGSSYAHHALARHYMPDQGGKGGDLERVVFHLAAGAELGDPDMMYELAFILEGGGIYGEVEDPDEAARWLLSAVENGHEKSLTEMRSNVAAWSNAFRKALQRRLNKAGYYEGKIDGQFGSASMEALEEYAEQAGF